MLGDSAICVGFGFASRYDALGLERVLSNVRPLLAEADIGFGNLEAVLSNRGLQLDDLGSRQMRGRPEYAPVLRQAGFNVLSVANNHAVQHGAAAFHDTVDILTQAGIHVCGLRGHDGWCSNPVLMTVKSVSVGILGYCLRPRQYGRETPPFAEGDRHELEADIARLKANVDHVIVSLHWGEEFVPEPSASEVALGESLVAAGASVIIGHHPHVARPVHRVRNAIVAYSLGNFVADMIWMREMRSGTLVRCQLTPTSVIQAEKIGITIGRDFAPSLAGPGCDVEGSSRAGLEDAVYIQKIKRSLARQRAAAYRYAFANMWRYPRTILKQMLFTTARNKLAALLSGK